MEGVDKVKKEGKESVGTCLESNTKVKPELSEKRGRHWLEDEEMEFYYGTTEFFLANSCYHVNWDD